VLPDPDERRGREARKSQAQRPRWRTVKVLPAPDARRAREAPTPLSGPFEMRDRKLPPLPDVRRARESRQRYASLSVDVLSRRRPFKEVS